MWCPNRPCRPSRSEARALLVWSDIVGGPGPTGRVMFGLAPRPGLVGTARDRGGWARAWQGAEEEEAAGAEEEEEARREEKEATGDELNGPTSAYRAKRAWAGPTRSERLVCYLCLVGTSSPRWHNTIRLASLTGWPGRAGLNRPVLCRAGRSIWPPLGTLTALKTRYVKFPGVEVLVYCPPFHDSLNF